MKTRLCLLFIFLSITSHGQITFTNATSNVQVNRGSVIIDSSFAMPTSVDYHHPHPWGRLSGRIIYSLADSIPRFYNGVEWSKFLSEGKAKQSQLINDMGYLNSETDPLFDSKYDSKNTDSISEGLINKFDKTVIFSSGKGTTVTGTYPNFTISIKPPTVNTSTRPIVSTAGSANGFQISATSFSTATYSITISTSVSLSGNSSGYVVLETCPTNSATAGDWVERSRITSGQSGTLVIGLVLNQVGGASMSSPIPIGHYARIRSVNVSGTPTYTFNSGTETIYD